MTMEQPQFLLRACRAALGVDLVLAAGNVGTRWLLGEGADLHVYDVFLAWNLPGHAVVIAMLLSILRSSGELAAVRGRLRIMLAAAAWTAVVANWIIGGFAVAVNLALAVFVVCTVRLFLGPGLGLWCLLSVIAADLVGAGLRIGGVFPERSAIPDYVLESSMRALGSVAWRAIVTTAMFVLTSFVAARFRAAESALRERNRELEQRLAAQAPLLRDSPEPEPSRRAPEALAATMTAPVGSDEHTVPARHPLPAALLSAAPGAPGIGSRLGRYELVEHLGAGAMGVVFEARDTELDRRVAVKIVSPRTGDADTARTRLRREAQAMARLSHPNVAAVFDIGTVGDQLFIAMELVRGKTLRALVGEDRPWRELLPILLAAARGLAAAHEAGVVHRDFKPDNVLLREDGAVRVSDFGLAREAADRTDRPRAADSGDAALDALVTATGAIVGTPAYLAPESARGIADAATDQFAFAVTAFELLEGRRPFESAHIVELLRGERTDLPMRPWRRRDLPAPLRATTERALAMAPAARWPSMDDLVGRLERAAERPTRTRVLLAALAAAGVMGAIAIARALTHEAPRPPVTAGLAAASLRWSETPLTFQGDLAAPVLSPDGELVAAFDTSGVVLVPTGGGEPRGIDLEPPPGAGYRRLTWSADGKRLLAMYMSSAQTFHSLSIDVSTHAMAPTPIGGGHALLIDEQLVVAAFPPDKALGFKSSAGTERSRCAIPGDYEWIDGLQAAQNAIYVEITWSDSTRALVVTDRACSSVRTAVPRSTVVDFVVGADGVIRAIRREEDGEVLVEYDSTGEPSGAPRHLPLGTSLLAGVRRDGGAVIMRRSTTWRLVDSGASATRELARATSRASLRLSPDQRRFAVVEFRPRKIPTLYIADRSNLNARGTALAEGVIAADWSLDGNSLAVITRSAAGIDLETIDVASGERRSSGSSDISPQGDVLWLDDRRIAYLRADHRTYQSFDRVTGTTQPIVDPSHGWTLGLARSPLDGSLAILWNRPDGPGVWLVSEDGASRWIRNTQGAWTFAWAHDGSLWMVEGARIDRYDPRTERVEPIRDLALEPTAQITAIFPLTDDHVLVQIENTTSDLVLFAPIASSNTGP